jgi:superfamily II DNA or RNA helicase
MATFDEFYRSLPEDSGKRGEFFEKVFVPWFLRTDPAWSNKIENIWLWDEYPDRWGKDCGIDLVYQDNTGKYWAVQSKCISPDREISKAEIDSFLSESNDPRIHGRLLIASTDGIGKNAMQVIERQEKQVVCFLREHFRQSEVEFPSTALDLATGRRKDKRRTRPHQEEAIRNVVEGIKTQDRGQLLMACGTGKTLTSLWIKEELNAKRTLVLLPSLSLLSQTLREWSATSREAFNWICVCSDKSVAKQDRTLDDWIEHVSEVGVPVTSDPAEIRQFLRDNKEGITFSTYQSSPLVAEAQEDADIPAFDLVFADEAHRCAGKVSEAFGCVLDSQKIRAQKRLFMTATPRVLSSRIKTKADAEDIEVASMDDESLFGTVLHRLNFSEAISKELLTDYRVVVIGVDDPEVQAQIIHRPLSATSNGVETDYETLANHISLAKAIRDYDLQRVITFHGRVKGAKKFSEDHPTIVDWLPTSSKTERAIQTGYVSGEMTSLERNNKISQLRNLKDDKVGVLCNARCLSEGVDVPSLDGIGFIDPRSSQVDIIQAVGRAIRKSEEKSFGYIILPVYLGDTENVEDEILASRFKDIWRVILALKSQDDSLSEVLDRLRVELGKRSGNPSENQGLTKIIFDLPKLVQSSIVETIQTLLIRNTTDDWQEMYGLLQRYWEENKSLPITGSKASVFYGKRLGAWVNKQRSTRMTMSVDRKNLLNGLAYWKWNPYLDAWDEKFQVLQRFLDKYGHASPKAREIFEGVKIGIWVGSQRQNKDQLEGDQSTRLESLNGWSWSPDEDTWNERFNLLKEYSEAHGNSCPKQRETYKGFAIGNWVNTQRSSRQSLKPEKIEMLQSLHGWNWSGDNANWNEHFNALSDYSNIYGHASPSQAVTHMNKNIGNWVSMQRQKKKNRIGRKSLTSDQINKLESLPGWTWDAAQSEWEKGFKLLVSYSHELGHSKPKNHESYKDFEIGKWVQSQRSSYKRNKLNQEKIDLLQSLPSWSWDTRVDQWFAAFDIVSDFVDRTQRLPASHEKHMDFSVGFWCHMQRKNRASLSEEQKECLEKLTLWQWNIPDQWSKSLNAYEKYVEHTNDASPKRNIVCEGVRIGDWVITQRVQYKKGKLSKERIEILESFPGWTWNPMRM